MRRDERRWVFHAVIAFLLLGLIGVCAGIGGAALDAGADAASTAPGKSAGKADSPHHGDPASAIFEVLAIVTVCAAIGRYFARRLGQSPVLGELLMGIVLGTLLYQAGRPTVLILRHADLVKETIERVQREDVAWHVAVKEAVDASSMPPSAQAQLRTVMLDRDFPAKARLAQAMTFFSSLGIVLLLFMVGLENNVDEMLRLGGKALAVGSTGVVATFALGLAAAFALFSGRENSLVPVFMAASMCSTSVGISARVFLDMGRLDSNEAKLVLGAGVADDILGLVVLAVMIGVLATGAVSYGSILFILFKAAAFLGAVVAFGKLFLRRDIEYLSSWGEHISLLVPFALLMLLASLADAIGLSTIIGAFAAGLIIEESFFTTKRQGVQPEGDVEALLAPLQELFAPIFFVLVGLQVDALTFLDPHILLGGLAMSAAAIAGKMCAPLVLGKGYDKLAIGAGLVPRGEVQLIFASLGKSLGVVDAGLFSVIVMVVLVTTVLAPAMLKRVMEQGVPS